MTVPLISSSRNTFSQCKKQWVGFSLQITANHGVILSCLTLTAFCTVWRRLLHFCTRFPPAISSTVSLCLSLPLPSSLPSFMCVTPPLSLPFLPVFFYLHLHSLLSSLSTSFHKVARIPVLCGFWALWSPFVTSSGTTTAGWSSRSWGWFCCCSCWASSSTQSLATWSRRYWGPDVLVASAPSSPSMLLYLTPLLPGFSCPFPQTQILCFPFSSTSVSPLLP